MTLIERAALAVTDGFGSIGIIDDAGGGWGEPASMDCLARKVARAVLEVVRDEIQEGPLADWGRVVGEGAIIAQPGVDALRNVVATIGEAQAEAPAADPSSA